jgi:hypothetical protein
MSSEPILVNSAPVPVGAIVAYCGELDKLKETGWHVCDGSEFKKDDYRELYMMIGTANGGTGDKFLIPDLEGRFLRGLCFYRLCTYPVMKPLLTLAFNVHRMAPATTMSPEQPNLRVTHSHSR